MPSLMVISKFKNVAWSPWYSTLSSSSFGYISQSYTWKVFKQRKQLIWNLKFHVETTAIFCQVNVKFHNIMVYFLHIMKSRDSLHEMISHETCISSNLVAFGKEGASQRNSAL